MLVKRITEGLSGGVIGAFLFGLLLSPIFAIGYYQRSKDLDERLSKACMSYDSIVDTLRNESIDESIERLRKPYKALNKNTIEGRVQFVLEADSNTIQDACSSVHSMTSSFPTHDEYTRGYSKYLQGNPYLMNKD